MAPEPRGGTGRILRHPAGSRAAARRADPAARLPGEPFPFPGHEPATLPRREVGPDRWPREEPETVVAPTEVVEPAVYPKPEPATPIDPYPDTDRDDGRDGRDDHGDGERSTGREEELGTAGRDGAWTVGGETAGVFISRVKVGPHAFERVVVRTHWFQRGEDLATALRRYLGPHLRPGDHVIISETAVIAARGRMIPAQQVRPGRLARLLARHVRPTGWGQGLSVPEKMQVAIAETGRLRILAAAAAAALTRPLGIRGVFYHVAGDGARCLDGMRAGSPYEGWVLPPLRRAEAVAIARELAQALGVPVHIVDINDNGGTIRASSHPFPPRLLLAILRDNPLGQGARCCPVGLIRRWEGAFGLLGDE
ncbi:hypothetical protein [Thermaerobacter composti]|uniref:Coenzyme F420:L-glutamate ligase-like domain-containing protein n=1 Tax=Thermaerobacter composti TaxID=554949 RepID=A0ABZ0QQR3_9FIRM|nr:hypothetical protein [Thermaerobacter composti]WPD19746.1 hypothetical protein Q5761_03530 [Thermaerobacter composti]